MLDAIFNSIPRIKILNALLLSPEKSYSPKQLAIDSGLSVVSIRRELNNLTKFGLIKEEKISKYQADSKRQKEKKFYSANRDFILYPEMNALITKAQILFSQKFVNDLEKICQLKFLALTGIFTNYLEAQTDILLVASIPRPIFLKLLQELEKDLGREINFTILSVREFKYREDIMDIFLYHILEGKTLILLDNIHKSIPI